LHVPSLKGVILISGLPASVYGMLPKHVFQPPRGMRDYLPRDLYERRVVENTIRELFRLYGYEEVETPTVEHYELLAAKVGEETRRTMYVFKDLAGRTLALRPEGTAPIARLVASKLKTAPKPLRLGYVWDFYRYDEPQRGRYRRFYQGGFELLGSSRPEADIEILSVSIELMRRLGFESFQVKLNNVNILRSLMAEKGVDEATQNRILGLADKKRHAEAIEELKKCGVDEDLISKLSRLFQLRGVDHRELMSEAERVLEGCENALEALKNLKFILETVKEVYPEPQYLLDFGFARGLEYYTGLIFEVFVDGLDIALIGGGRYDKLVELYGGEPTPAVGCAPGIDRLVLAMKLKNIMPDPPSNYRVYLCILNEKVLAYGFKVSARLRAEGIPVEMEVMGRKLSKTLSIASSRGFLYTVIIGPKEAESGLVSLKDMAKGVQETLTVEEMLKRIKIRLQTLHVSKRL